MMKLDLEVLASTDIRRKKPWPNFAWLGQEKESLFLLDKHRLSVLYLPSGKTTRKIPKLSPHLEDVLAFSTTCNGHFLVYLLKSGDVAVWHKDSDMLKLIPGLLENLTNEDLLSVNISLCLSDDCSLLLVVINFTQFYVWEKDARQNVLTAREEDLQGMWSKVVAPDNIPLPYSERNETCSDIIMYTNKVLGRCCQYSVVWTVGDKLSLSTVLLRFHSEGYVSNRTMGLKAEWSNIQYPVRSLNTACQPIVSPGSYVVRYSPDGQILAVGVNQRSASLTSLLFISPLTETVVVSHPKHLGTDPQKKCIGKDYWLVDLAWTYDSLFVVLMTGQGSVSVAPRLGDPLPLQSSGCGLDMGPSYYLPLHPLISISYHSSSAGHSDTNSLRQRFSLATNPRLPMILCSDGYRVTVLHLPPELSCMTLARGLVLESTKHMARILQHDELDLTLADAYKLPSNKKQAKGQRYKFEKPNPNSSMLSEDSLEGSFNLIGDVGSGKITFGNAEALSATIDTSFGDMDRNSALLKHFERAQRSLFTAWGIIASHNESWSPDMENLSKHTLKNIQKLYSILLDSACMESILSKLEAPSPSGNQRVIKLVGSYRSVFHLLQFDAMTQDLRVPILKFIHGTLDLMLGSKWLKEHDTRLRTFSGCLAILKFTETTINKMYIWLPQTIMGISSVYEPAYLTESSHQESEATAQGSRSDQAVRLDQVKDLPSNRLCISWKLLYNHMVKYQSKIKQIPGGSEEEWNHLNRLISALQNKLQQLDTDINVKQNQQQSISAGDELCLNGQYTQALEVWKDQLKNISGGSQNKKVCKLCHAQLYTFLLRGDLKQALDLVDSLLLQSNVSSDARQDVIGQESLLMTLVTSTMRYQSDGNPDKVPCIRNKAVRKLVQSLARFMAAYFTGQTLFVYPRHNPQPLPPVHMDNPLTNIRLIPIYHRDVTDMVRRSGLTSFWTTGRTVEYLMLSGLVVEGAWFADHMGDWKTAFILSVAAQQHNRILSDLYTSANIRHELPENLLPRCILERALQGLAGKEANPNTSLTTDTLDMFLLDDRTDLTQLAHTLEWLMKAGIMSDVDITPWLLQALVKRLRDMISNLHPLVPSDVYLPSPPLYCPQPSKTSEEMQYSPDGELEMSIRGQASSLTHLILTVLEASHLSLPLLRWYIKDLAVIQSRASQFKATTEGPCEDLPDILKQHQGMTTPILVKISHPSVQTSMQAFRDFCSIQWLLHARDKLSTLLRHREKYLSNLNYQDYMMSTWAEEEDWLKECFTCLQWAVNLLPFSGYLPEEGSLYKVVLSLLIELPPSEDTADILAENLHDYENLDSDVQEKLAVLLKQWQRVIVTPEDDGKSARGEDDTLNDSKDGKKSVTFLKASPRGKTLSLYFEKQCQAVHRLLKKKAKIFGRFDELVFWTDPSKLQGDIKQTPGVDLFIGSRPFESKQSFMEFMDYFSAICFSKLVDSEAESSQSDLPLVEPFAKEVKKREMQSLAYKIVNSMRKKESLAVLSTPRDFFVKSPYVSMEPKSPFSPRQGGGLFRSKSLVESETTKRDKKVDVLRSVSEGGVDAISEKDTNTPTKSPSKVNLTDMASKFGQSEEVLYKEHDQNEGVSLDIDFGKKYSNLQSLLEWLTRWADKHHSLILGETEHLQPKVRIKIPPQLIVLAVWLVENKYNNPLEQQEKNGRDSQPVIHDQPNNSSNTEAREAVENGSSQFTTSSRAKKSKNKRRVKLSEQVNTSVVGEVMDEQLDVRVAYAEVLHGVDGSLDNIHQADQELISSLSTMRSGGSPIRSQEFLTGSFRSGESYNEQFSKTPDTVVRRGSKHLRQVLNRSDDKKEESSRTRSSRGRSLSPQARYSSDQERRSPTHHRSVSPELRRYGSPSTSNQENRERPQSGSPQRSRWDKENSRNGDITSQLQRVVRSELRRMMEVQHKSMLAMMGALDETVRPVSPMQRSPGGSTRSLTLLGSSQRSQGTMGSDELKHSPKKMIRRKNVELRGILQELKGLQQENVRQQYTQSSHIDNLLQENDRSPGNPDIPRFLRVEAERDTTGIRLPQLAAPRQDPTTPLNIITNHVRMPLLKLDADFPGVYGQNVCRSEGFGQLPPPGYFEVVSQRTPPVALPPPQAGGHLEPGFPLLRLQSDAPLHQFNSNALEGGQYSQPNQKEAVKEKLIQSFQQIQRENYERHNLDKFGKQFLRVDFQALDKPKPIGDRENEKRRQRRMEKQSKSETSDDIDKENVSSETLTSPEAVKASRRVKMSKQKQAVKRGEDQTHIPAQQPESGALHDGYAIPTGIFDSYLKHEDEFGERQMNNAKFQYEAAKSLEKQRQMKRMVDFSTMTKEQVDVEIETDLAKAGVRTAEVATSIAKDAGTDPIQEALIEYNRCIQGNILAPDIYLGLRFGEDTPAHEQVSEPTRGFLNVVDIRASSVLRDLEGRGGQELPIQPDLSLKPTSVRVSTESSLRQHLGDREDELRESLRPRERVGGDSLTLRLFQRSHMTDNSVTAAVFSGSQARERSRETVIRQLWNMDVQLRAIDEMSSTMQQDFANTRQLLSTIESVGEIIHANHDESSPRSAGGKTSPLSRQHTPKDDTARSSLTPVLSEKSPQRSVRSQPISPGASQRRTKDSMGHPVTKVSGLSGISDIIGEMLAEGGIDLTEAGLTPDEARQLTRQVALNRQSQLSGFDSVKMSVDKLQQIVNEAGPNANRDNNNDRRRDLQEWMISNRHKQQAEFKKHRQQLREAERDPFKPSHEINRDEEILGAEKHRQDQRKTMAKENVEKRFTQATKLLGDILFDNVVLPEAPPPSQSPSGSPKSARFSTRTHTRVITPRGVKSGARPKTAPSYPVPGSPSRNRGSSARTGSFGTFRISEGPSFDQDDRPIRPMPKPFLEERQQFQDSRERADPLSKYARVIDSLETITESGPDQMESGAGSTNSEPDEESTAEPYRPRPYTEIVRLQRPQVTRKEPNHRPITADTDSPYSDRQPSTATSTPRQYKDTSQADKEKLYGSKHIPGTSRVKTVSPQRVKTYTERLQDMKKSKKVYTTPIVPRQAPPKQTTSEIPRRTFHGPMHKPMTYTQQLQQLSNRNVPTARGTSRQVYVRPKVGIRSTGPRHKPLTYTQQKQKLNQQAPKTFRQGGGVQSQTFTAAPQRQTVRSRPYADPYSQTEQVPYDVPYTQPETVQAQYGLQPDDYDIETDLSSWEVDERVKQILYNDEDASSYGARALSSREYQASEGISDYYDVIMSNEIGLSNEYSDSVDVGRIRDIADAVSVSSGSIMSFIDWDAVDQIIGPS